MEEGRLCMTLQEDLNQRFRAGAHVEGSFRFTDKEVLTAVVVY
jgi:hypothetical protein